MSYFLARPRLDRSLFAGEKRDTPFLRVRKSAAGCVAEGQPEQAFGAAAGGPAPCLPGDVHAAWRWDGRTVSLRTCRYGFFPLYYFASEERFAVAPSLSALLAQGVPAEPDDAAVAVFLRLGFLLGEDTVFKHIRVAPPNARITWSAGRLDIEAQPYRVQPLRMSREEAIDGYIRLFRQAIRRRLPTEGEFALPLSGGRDSRHLLLELLESGRPPKFCVTTHEFPPYSEEDIRVAGLLAARAGIPHRVLRQPGSRIRAEVRKNRMTDYGAMEHAWSLVLADYLAGTANWVYDGIAGDFLSGGAQLIPEQLALYERGRFEELARRLLSGWVSYGGYEDVLARILRPEFRRRFSLEAAVGRLSAALARHAEAPNPLGSFHVWERARRGIGLYTFGTLARRGITAVTPYLDSELFDFLSSLPATMFLDKSFHTETIRRAFPRYADIPFENPEAPLKRGNGHFRRLVLEAAAYISARGTGKYLDRKYLLPRLLELALKPGIDVERKLAYLAPATAVYLAQLEALDRE